MRKPSAVILLLIVTGLSASLMALGTRGKPPASPGINKVEARKDMRYTQPYANPQKNSFQPVKLIASGKLGKKITYNDGSVAGSASYIFLLDDDRAVIDFESAIFAVNMAERKCLGYKNKSRNSFVALGTGDIFYYAASNQLIQSTLSKFDARQPDFFVPGLGDFSQLCSFLPKDETFVAAVQNKGNPMYPDPSFSLFEKAYPALSENWKIKIPGTALPPPFSLSNLAILAKPNSISVIDDKGEQKGEFSDEFMPVSCSVGPDDIIYLVCSTKSGVMLQAFDLNLEKKWETVCDKANLEEPPIVDSTATVYLVGGGSVTAFQNGRLLWESPLGSSRAKGTLAGNGLLVISDSSRVVCLDRSGIVKWVYEDKNGEIFLTPPVIDSQGSVFVASNKTITMIE
jgi:hypothetical protein